MQLKCAVGEPWGWWTSPRPRTLHAIGRRGDHGCVATNSRSSTSSLR
jgi:hypothetical protein